MNHLRTTSAAPVPMHEARGPRLVPPVFPRSAMFAPALHGRPLQPGTTAAAIRGRIRGRRRS